MEAIKKLRDFIRNLDETEFYKYTAIFLAIFFILFGLISYINYNRTRKYNILLEQINQERTKTKRILSEFKLVSQQKAKVDEILAQKKDFFIAQEFNNILQKLGLATHQPEEPTRSDGPIISGKSEQILTSHLYGLTMKQVTDLLTNIAEVERLFPKELTIKKTPHAQTVDIDLVIATLEQATTE